MNKPDTILERLLNFTNTPLEDRMPSPRLQSSVLDNYIQNNVKASSLSNIKVP